MSIAKDGSYKVTVGDKAWFYSGETWFQVNGTRFSTADDSLKLINYEQNIGMYKKGKLLQFVLVLHCHFVENRQLNFTVYSILYVFLFGYY